MPIKILSAVFRKTKQTIPRFVWNHKYPEQPKQSCERRTKMEVCSFISNIFNYKAIAIKREWYWYKNGYVDQWNRMESSEINQYIYGQLIYDKRAKNIH